MRTRSNSVLLSASISAGIVLCTLAALPAVARADDAADAVVRQVVQQIQNEQPALAEYRIECTWNKQPGVNWTITGRSMHSAMGWFEQMQTFGLLEDIVFPTGLFSQLRRHIDPFPDAKSMRPAEARLLVPADVEGTPCSVIEFTNKLPLGGLYRDGGGANGMRLREWDSATLRWYVDAQHHVRRISGVFQWKEWAGETDVQLSMNALVLRRKPKTGVERASSPPPLRRIQVGSEKVQVCVFAYSPDGRRFVAGSDLGTTLYDTSTWKPVAKLDDEPISAAAFSPDNAIVMTAGWKGSRLRLWDAVTGKEKSSIESGAAMVRSCVFLPHNRLLIGGTGGGALVWDRAAGAQTGPRMAGSDRTVVVSADGRWAASEKNSAILLHDLDGKEPDRTLGTPAANRSGTSAPPSLAFSPDGKRIAIGYNWVYRSQSEETENIAARDPRVRVFEVATSRLVVSLAGSNGTILSLAFSPDGRILAAGDEDNIGETIGTGAGVLLWDTASWKLLGVMAVDGQPAIRSIVFAPDGKTLATTGYSSVLKIWTVPTFMPKL